MARKIKKILVANRGVPAVRVMQTCRDLKIPTVAVYSTPDRLSLHVFMADEAVHIGEGPPLKSYLNMDRIVEAALSTAADAVHPGWGFLAENAEFARKVIEAGLTWIGPDPEIIALMGDKKAAKEIAKKANVPTIPGIEDPQSPEEVLEWIRRERIDFPIMLKAALGGGGKGMVKVENEEELPAKFSHAQSEAYKAFGDSSLIAEQYIERGRHIEVQIVGDKHGHIVHLFERECTIQRRNQKIIEETPAPSLDDDLRQEICFTAVRLMRELGYDSAGTVEFLLDAETRKFYFLEVNTRLQVEHGVTELATGLDIVDLMIQIAEGKALPLKQQDIRSNRWAIECRLTAEDPRTFAPSFGTITRLQIPDGPNIRISAGVYEGAEIPPYYDSMFMLIMSAGADRDQAIRVMDRALSRGLRVEGVKTIAPLLISIIRHPAFRAGEFSTKFIEEHMEELISAFKDKDPDEEVLKIARYVAEISALGPQKWM